MILDFVSITALFLDQTKPAPCAVQCAPSAGPDPLLVRLLFAAIPSIFALGIAWLVFVWNGGREHKLRIRAQKTAEWKELIEHVTELKRAFPSGPNKFKSINSMIEEFQPAIRELKKCRSRCLFIADVLNIKENNEKFLEFVNKLDEGERDIRANDVTRTSSGVQPWDDAKMVESELQTYDECYALYNSFEGWIVSIAHGDLGIKECRVAGK